MENRSSASELIRQVLATSLVTRLIGSTIVFFVNSAIWATLFEYYFPDFGGSLLSFAGASLSLIVGTIYGTFLTKMMQDYLAGPRRYVELLVQIGNAGDAIAGLYASLPVIHEHLIKIRFALQVIAFYSYRIFSPGNSDGIGLTKYQPAVSLSQATRSGESVAKLIAQNPVVYKVSYAPDDLLVAIEDARYESPMKIIHTMRIYLYREIADIQAKKVIDGEVLQMALKTLDPVWDQLETIESGSLVSEPIIFKAHMQALFIFYFFLWVPISAWAAVGWAGGVIGSTILSLIFLGPGVYNDWIGDAFDPERPVLVANLTKLRTQYAIDEMEEKFMLIRQDI